METVKQTIEQALSLMGFKEAKITIDEEHRKISIFIDDELVQSEVEQMLPALDHLGNVLLRKEGLPPYMVDLNFYRKERERLIIELARAAAKKAAMKKESVELPPMNSYERRIVHMELADKPDLQTESIGEARDRRVVIKLIEG
ncbi:MAG: R3H domain-containing nucleic acid-binding protein [bacterium]|nr:R3H domain-containing nucleic acid-binding protein [bacterium]